ncbi:MAG: DHH family phosphoesterase [Candidatus Staskawiczbacteria bacterium]|nr:DHH family phosphoesterase [Candidatus Staskawiczbacteria bacterium]
MKIKNIEKAAERIKKAVLDNERIILYGDSDLDGITSVIILEETIKNLGGKVESVFFPDRENDGYGVNMKALDILKNKAPALFITLDLGIGNLKEAIAAKKIGFDMVIIDHHETLQKKPDVPIIVDPKQKDDSYPFKGLANAGIVFKLSKEMLGSGISENLENSFSELAALGSIADMVPKVDENEEIIKQGINSLKKTWRPGLKAFFEILEKYYTFQESVQKAISAMNSAETKDYKNNCYFLLTCSDYEECNRLANSLIERSKYRQREIKGIAAEVERRISKKNAESIVFEGDPAWRLTLAGPVASIVCQKYEKPVFIFKRGVEESCGSVRNPNAVNSVEAMKTCKDILISYGGHAVASGFRLKNEDLDKFKTCLISYFKNLPPHHNEF